MSTVTAMEASANFRKLLDRVARGEEIIITRREKPVARLVPEGEPKREEVREAVAGLRELQSRIARRLGANGKLSDAEVKSWIEEGRR